ncbi:MAG: MFS transporter [Candidatus Eremiobacteraeota bacterium]|nr:MFS transporter [Candidatus Eremiobacteraeota bacterium]
MRTVALLGSLTKTQRSTFIASFLGWTLDAFDFFLITFVVVRLSSDFGKTLTQITFAITITLVLRPVGAILFGFLADKYGRRVPLMIDIGFYSVVELLTAFSPNFTVFLILRALYGVGMGGEWGVGAALAMESLPPKSRGFFSGLLQEGYAFGFLLAGAVYVVVTPHFGWRAMFVVGVLPALLIFYIRARVPESAVWQAGASRGLTSTRHFLDAVLKHWPLFVYAIGLMAAFNFMSHGTQDLYPTFLQRQHGFNPNYVFIISSIASIGAICGGILFGTLSQRFGRRRCIVAAAILGIAMIPLWAFSSTIASLAVGGFLMQFMVQGAWGIIPAHLNELSPEGVRGMFPGVVYQIGNVIAAGAAQIESGVAASHFRLPSGGADYGHAMAVVIAVVFGTVILLTLFGHEAREVEFAHAAAGN